MTHMKRSLLTIQYLGTQYAGWQTQNNAKAIQQVIEEALLGLCESRVRIEAAGRTDSGVHAEAQRAHVDVPINIDERGLVLGLNDRLPRDIRVTGAEWVPENFHARFDATGKTYVYRIWNAAVASVFFDPTYAHVPSPLDVERMRSAAQALTGTHDFKSFTVVEPEVSSTIRTVEEVTIDAEPPVIRISITADGFLRYMVRRIAGSLIEVGRGKLTADALGRALEPNFEEARWTAPAHGLVLKRVIYGAKLPRHE